MVLPDEGMKTILFIAKSTDCVPYFVVKVSPFCNARITQEEAQSICEFYKVLPFIDQMVMCSMKTNTLLSVYRDVIKGTHFDVDNFQKDATTTQRSKYSH